MSTNDDNMAKMEEAAAHSEVTIALAKKESAEHMEGMKELYDSMREKPLIIKAYALDDPNAPADAKTVHFVRHGQGFHNLMADLAKAEGREWVQVRQTKQKTSHVSPLSFCRQSLTLSCVCAVYKDTGKPLRHARDFGFSLDRQGSAAGIHSATSGAGVGVSTRVGSL